MLKLPEIPEHSELLKEELGFPDIFVLCFFESIKSRENTCQIKTVQELIYDKVHNAIKCHISFSATTLLKPDNEQICYFVTFIL